MSAIMIPEVCTCCKKRPLINNHRGAEVCAECDRWPELLAPREEEK